MSSVLPSSFFPNFLRLSLKCKFVLRLCTTLPDKLVAAFIPLNSFSSYKFGYKRVEMGTNKTTVWICSNSFIFAFGH